MGDGPVKQLQAPTICNCKSYTNQGLSVLLYNVADEQLLYDIHRTRPWWGINILKRT